MAESLGIALRHASGKMKKVPELVAEIKAKDAAQIVNPRVPPENRASASPVNTGKEPWQMAERGVELADFESYLHARHAPEANRVMKERNPTEQELQERMDAIYAQIEPLEAFKVSAAPRKQVRLQRLIDQGIRKIELLATVQPWRGSDEDRQKLSGMSNEEAATIMAGLMHDATLAQIAPSKPYVYGNDKARYMMRQGRLKLLGDDAKTVYRETRDAYKGHRHQGATPLLMKESG